ncbi:hypothetical protein JL721_13025 [Aureococcus anophagefferens]|nr:hypothetical protein JL721_13025 [Aureococcus anophagefferens]
MTLFVPRDEAAARAGRPRGRRGHGVRSRRVATAPVGASVCGVAAELGRPDFAHVFLRTSADTPTRTERNFERALYLYRRSLRGAWDRDEELYVASCSLKTTIYKGMVNAASLKLFYGRLQSEDYVSHRSLDRAAGEINTVRGNVNWMVSRAEAAGGDLGAIAAGCSSEDPDRVAVVDEPRPVVAASRNRLGEFGRVLELYTRAGRTVDESLLMMMPPAIPAENEKVFFDLHAPLQEPWDGPASVCFSDGNVIGARLTATACARRASRATATASEILERKRLGPGMSCLIDLVANDGGYYDDKAVKARIASNPKWQEALDRQRRLADGDMGASVTAMVKTGGEATHCMGADAPLAAMSTFAHPAYDYFKQRHAQVTNPPIDPIREKHVMTTET